MYDGIPYEHASVSIISSELINFLGHKDKPFLAALMDWYDSEDKWKYRTKGGGTDDIPGVCLTLLGGATPDNVLSSIPEEAIGSGLTSRIIFVYEETREKVIPLPKKTKDEEELFEKLVEDLEQIKCLVGEFSYTKDFEERFNEWYFHDAKSPPVLGRNFEAYCARRGTHLLKLCMIVKASESDDMILDATHLDRANEILLSTEKKMSKTFGGMGANILAKTANEVLDYIEKSGAISLETILKKFWKDVTKRTLEEDVLETMIAAGLVTKRLNTKERQYYYEAKQ